MRTIAFAITNGNKSPGEQFYSNDLDAKGRLKMDKLFVWMGDHGQINNEEKFKHVAGALWEFKDRQIRMPCYRSGDTWVITHGFIKKQDRMPAEERVRAEKIMAQDMLLCGGQKNNDPQSHN